MNDARTTKCVVSDVMGAMESIAPAHLAAPGDHVGLQAGTPGQPVARVLVALEASVGVLARAARVKGTLVVTHHPRIYRPLGDLRLDRFGGAVAAAVLRHDIALFAAHTNLDVAPGGVNDNLAAIAGLRDATVLATIHRLSFSKLTVFVPVADWEKVAAAVCAAGAGRLGKYRDCVYRVLGKGRFRPGVGARPHLGRVGRLTEVEECRLEALVAPGVRKAVEKALLATHPYEEPAYDFAPCERAEDFGFGRVGRLSRPTTLGAYAKRMKRALASPGVLCAGVPAWPVARVAVWSGAGVDVGAVLRSGVDAIVCGELDHHSAEALCQARVGAIVVGHGPSEEHVIAPLAKRLAAALPGVPIVPVVGGDAAAHYFRGV